MIVRLAIVFAPRLAMILSEIKQVSIAFCETIRCV